ncbi:MAG: ribosome modulation factor [Glaciecola sp.]
MNLLGRKAIYILVTKERNCSPNIRIHFLLLLFLNKRGLSMKRQKRDKLTRAHAKGYQAGISGRSKELCPFQAAEARSEWLGGWREALTDRNAGLVGR